MRKDDCPLCKAEHLTKWYYEDEKIWIALCKTCQVPMVVWKEHKSQVAADEYNYMIWKCSKFIPDASKYRVDSRMKALPEHFHMHFR